MRGRACRRRVGQNGKVIATQLHRETRSPCRASARQDYTPLATIVFQLILSFPRMLRLVRAQERDERHKKYSCKKVEHPALLVRIVVRQPVAERQEKQAHEEVDEP